MVKEFEYRGVPTAELERMQLDKVIPLLGARQRRSLKRGVTDGKRRLVARIREAKKAARSGAEGGAEGAEGGAGGGAGAAGAAARGDIRTHLRDLIVLPFMVGATVHVFNGKEFRPVEIKPEMIGHYIGEYSLTSRRVSHGAPGVGASRSSLYVPLK